MPWLAIAFGYEGENTQIFHSIAQIQGFMLCFALGFLFTMVPRRTGTWAPNTLEMVLGLGCPVAITLCAALKYHALSQAFWFVLVATLAQFLVRRFRQSTATGPSLPAFVWLPIGLLQGVAGAVLFGLFGALDLDYDIHRLAQRLLLQGLFLSLVVGVGSMVFPLFTRGEGPGKRPAPPRFAKLIHVFGAALLVSTFFFEVYGWHHTGLLGRGVLCGALLVFGGRVHRLPTKPGANRWLVFFAIWMIPIGYLLAGIMPPHYVQIGMHIVFIGGFATMAMAVAAHVALAHGGRKPELDGWPVLIVAYAALFQVAVVARALMLLDDLDRYQMWLGVAAGAFLLGSLAWAALVVPALLRKPEA